VGISIQAGIGKYTVRDQYISRQRYSGHLPFYSIGFARQHADYVYRLDMAFRNASLENYNVTTNLTQLVLHQGFIYTLQPVSIFDKDLALWLGPASELYLMVNNPDFAVSGFEYTQSFVALFALGVDAEVYYPLLYRTFLESTLRLSVLSLGFRTVDQEEDDTSPVKLLTLFSGLNMAFNFGFRYDVCNHLSFALKYHFEYARINAWDPIYAASDNAIIRLTYKW